MSLIRALRLVSGHCSSEISDDIAWRKEVKIVAGPVLLVRYVFPLFSLADGDPPNVYDSSFSGETA
jgi:hypothetical protein